jgi:hypothetical protein
MRWRRASGFVTRHVRSIHSSVNVQLEGHALKRRLIVAWADASGIIEFRPL